LKSPKHAARTSATRKPLSPHREGHECFNIDVKQDFTPKEENSEVDEEDEVDLVLRTEFEEGRPTFDESMTTI